MLRAIWDELYPDEAWPGSADALRKLAEEVRALRLLTDTTVKEILDDQIAHRSMDEIQRAHDIVGQYCVETRDVETFEHVSALCWVLRHDHNTAFAQSLETVEFRLEQLGLHVVRLPDLVDPAKGEPDAG